MNSVKIANLQFLGRILLALAAGLILALSFAPFSWWPLAPVGVALFSLTVKDLGAKRSALVGYIFGLGLFGITVSYVAVMGLWVGILLVCVMSGYGALLGVTQYFVQKLPAWPLWIAASWTLTEAIWQRFPIGGFGWIRLAFTSVDQPLGGYLWIIGAAGTGFLIALIGALLAWGYLRWKKRQRNRILVCLGVIAALFLGGALGMAVPVTTGGDQIAVGVIQGNVDGSAGSRSMGYARSVTNNHLSETITLMAKARTGLEQMPDFILWPENATDNDPTKDAQTAQTVQDAINLAQRPVFVGAVMRGPGVDERQTSGLWYDVNGQIVDRYDKQNAVPFGEYTPMKSLVFKLVPMAREVGAQTVEGTEPGVLNVSLDSEPLNLGDIICYELAYDNTVYEMARGNPNIVVVQSNNATYTGTVQPIQQFVITRVRAMEMRREIVVSTTSSYSGLIDAKGKTLARSQEGTAASATFIVPSRDYVSPGVRIGPIIEIVISIIGLISILAGIAVGRGRGIRITRHESKRS